APLGSQVIPFAVPPPLPCSTPIRKAPKKPGLVVSEKISMNEMVAAMNRAASRPTSQYVRREMQPGEEDDNPILDVEMSPPYADNGQFNNGRLIIRCQTCGASVEEREVPRHNRMFHSAPRSDTPGTPCKVVLQCSELACDFTCDTREQRLTHTLMIHDDTYRKWTAYRLQFPPGTLCPYCGHSVRDVVSLNQHMLRDHIRRLQKPENIFACSSCDTRFNKLYLIYQHWYAQPQCRGPLRLQSHSRAVASSGPPRAIVERAKDLITGPRGQQGFKQLAESYKKTE
ncbi:hypothetical protein PFISCL1PPCAC_27946, partial [Pristionchus fissidentatus]